MRNFVSLMLVVCSAVLAASVGRAATIGFAPSSSVVGLGSFSVDIVVSDLGGEIVSAYDLDVLYDDSILQASSVSFGSGLGDAGLLQVLESSSLATSGLVDLAAVSLLSDADLLALQGGDSVVLATLGFDAIATGTSALEFSFDAFNDVKTFDAEVLDLDVEAGSVSVIPEPSAAVVFGIGWLILGLRLRR